MVADSLDAMALLTQLMMAFSLAACAGLRAWLPLFALGLATHFGVVLVHPGLSFLGSDAALFVFGAATVIEVLGDKIIALDHLLDVVGTFFRPVAGVLLAYASLRELDPLWATLAAVMVGGGTALTVHAGKSAVRAKTSLLAPFHAGLGNAAVSVGEDLAALVGVPLAILSPVLAFVFALCLLVLAVLFVILFVRAGQHLYGLFSQRRAARSRGVGPAW